MPRLKKWGKFVFGVPLTILSFVFLFRILYSSWGDVSIDFSEINVSQFLLGVLFLALYFLLRGLVWCKVLRSLDHHVPWTKGAYLLSLSELRRYIPGSVFAVATRVSVFEKFGISRQLLVSSQVVELSLLLIASTIVAIPGVLFMGDHVLEISFLSGLSLSVVYGLYALLFVGLLCVAFGSLRYVRKKLHEISKSVKNNILFDAFFVSLLTWVFFGLGNFCIVLSIFPIWLSDVVPISSFFVLAWMIGFLVFVTPSGLGVRELIVTIGLTPFIGPGAAAASAVITRIVLIGAELLAFGFTYVVKRDSQSSFFRIPWQWMVLGLSIASYVFYFTYVSFLKHSNFLTGKFDLGNMDQTVWNTLHGRFFQLSDPNGVGMMSRLGIHADFFLVLLAPLYILWQDPRMLLFVQSLVLGVGAIYVYLLANEVLKNRTLALVFGISYLLNFWVQRQNVFDFHAVALGTTFLVAAFYYFIKKRYVWFSVFLILSVLTKENVYLVASFFGVYLFFRGSRWLGAGLFVLSLLGFYLLVSYFIPHYRPQGNEHFGLTYFAALGDSPSQIIINGLTKPHVMAMLLWENGGLFYVFQTLLPTGFLSLLSPVYLVFAAGDYLINIISDNPWLRTIFFHYGALIIPFVYVSSIYGAQRLMRWHIPFVSSRQFLIYYVLFFAVLSAWLYGVSPGSRWQSVGVFIEPYADAARVESVLQSIPEDISISATNNLAAHLSYREKIYVIPQGMDADVVLFLNRPPFDATSEDEQYKLFERMLSNYDYELIYATGEFYVFSRVEQAPRLEMLLPTD